jgi:hypothetical protein
MTAGLVVVPESELLISLSATFLLINHFLVNQLGWVVGGLTHWAGYFNCTIQSGISSSSMS